MGTEIEKKNIVRHLNNSYWAKTHTRKKRNQIQPSRIIIQSIIQIDSISLIETLQTMFLIKTDI